MKRIQNKLHEIGTYDVFKISLSCFDDKRYVLDDGINTLAFFHKDKSSIKNYKLTKSVILVKSIIYKVNKVSSIVNWGIF